MKDIKFKRNFPYFYVIYGALMVLAIAAIAVGLLFFSSFLSDYEASLPKYVAGDIFNENFSPPDYGKLCEHSGAELTKYEGNEQLLGCMQEKFKDKLITYREVSAGMSDIKKYSVKAGDDKVAEFTLKKSGEKSKYGFDLWELDGIRVPFTASVAISVKIISDSTLTLNGINVGEDAISESAIATASSSHMPHGVEGIKYNIYSVTGLLTEPDISVTDRFGNASTVVYDEEEKIYIETPNNDTALSEEYSELAINAAEAYACFMTRDAYTNTLNKYFDVTTETYRLIKNCDIWCYSDHLGYEFVDVTTGEFYSYDENTFSCRYTCMQNIYFTEDDTRTSKLDLTLYFHNIDGEFLVYDLVTNY